MSSIIEENHDKLFLKCENYLAKMQQIQAAKIMINI